MNIQSIESSIAQWSGDCLGIGLFEGEENLSSDIAALNDALGGAIAALIEEAEFQGKASEQLSSRIVGTGSIKNLIVVGLGKTDELKLDGLRKKAAAIAKYAKQQRSKTLGISLPVFGDDGAQSAQAIAEGITLALHKDNRFKSDPNNGKPEVNIESVDLFNLGSQSAALEKAQQMCEGVILARELVNAPANVITPVTLAETAEDIADTHSLTAKILEREECEALGMGAYLGVAQASDLPPKFIHLTYSPAGEPKRKLAIIGKGLTFDSGGLNIKPSGSGIETMKMDMGGSAATLGAAKVIGMLKPDVEVHFIVAATENMISGNALHPGDILTASNGKTIEINNTDAEGRLTLADALVYAEKLEVDAMVDLATLTGACIVALGNDIAGLWTAEEELATEIKAAADQSGEKFWQMPLESAYFDGLKSSISDMKNTGPRAGGSITAALFLQKFVESTPWAHLDVAGPVWADKESGYNGVGGTGFAVRTLVNWVMNS